MRARALARMARLRGATRLALAAALACAAAGLAAAARREYKVRGRPLPAPRRPSPRPTRARGRARAAPGMYSAGEHAGVPGACAHGRWAPRGPHGGAPARPRKRQGTPINVLPSPSAEPVACFRGAISASCAYVAARRRGRAVGPRATPWRVRACRGVEIRSGRTFRIHRKIARSSVCPRVAWAKAPRRHRSLCEDLRVRHARALARRSWRGGRITRRGLGKRDVERVFVAHFGRTRRRLVALGRPRVDGGAIDAHQVPQTPAHAAYVHCSAAGGRLI